jgi:adenylylsulfate kinase-like enzyme
MSQPQRLEPQYEDPFRYPSAPVPVADAGEPNQPATLILMVGLPAAGKTTRAKELAVAHQALRLTPDHWMIPLFGDSIRQR